jgi:hypothetical protein
MTESTGYRPPQQADERCKCKRGPVTNAPWNYMGPWHENRCWLYVSPRSISAAEGEFVDGRYGE